MSGTLEAQAVCSAWIGLEPYIVGGPLWEGLALRERDWDSSGLSRQRLSGS